MANVNNPPKVKIESNIKVIEQRWRYMMTRVRPNLLRNMQDVALMLKTDVAVRKLQGQILNRRTGTLIRSLMPNSPVQAARFDGDTVTGTVGAQGAVAPYAKRLEQGGPAYSFGPAAGRPFSTGKPKPALPADDPRARLRFLIMGREVFVRNATMPAAKGRWFIKGTIREREREIRQALLHDLVEFPR